MFDILFLVCGFYGLHSIIYYLDYFLVISPLGSRVCHTLLTTLQHVFEVSGVWLAAEKTEGPVTKLTFLGIVIDKLGMECRLPLDKLEDLRVVQTFNKISTFSPSVVCFL